MTTRKAISLSLASWLFLALCYPPLPLGPCAMVFLAPWIYVLKTANKKAALVASYLGAFLFHIISMYWLYYVGKVAPPALIYSGLLLGVAYLSLYALLNAWVFVKIRDMHFGKFPLIYLFPFFWAGIEALRARGDMSFPWLSLGLVFGNNFKLMQSFALFGVFGCSAIIIASNLCFVESFMKKKYRLALAPVALALSLYIGGIFFAKDEVAGDEGNIAVAVVQPSIHQTKKWSREYFDSVMTQTWDLFETLDPAEIDLVVFPETSIPDYIDFRWQERDFLRNYADENKLAIVAGALNRSRNIEKKRRGFNIYNSAFLFSPNHEIMEYRKINLVPFSEKIPFHNIVPIVNYVDLGGGEFSPGDSLSIWQPGNFSPLICYEAIYGSILRKAKQEGAKFIVNITNDGWFMRSSAPYQHLNLVRAHAIENGIGVVRAANTGISAFIAPNGAIFDKTELFEQKIMLNHMPLKTRFTPYSVIGDYIEFALIVFSLLAILLAIIRKGSPTKKLETL
jgi:apolipoprotein N-acyltransferase